MLRTNVSLRYGQEISWHRIDDLQPAGDDAISRGVNGLKLYMVAPFLTSVTVRLLVCKNYTAEILVVLGILLPPFY